MTPTAAATRVLALSVALLFSAAQALTANNGQVVCVTNCSDNFENGECPDLRNPINITASPLCGLSSEVLASDGQVKRITRLFCDGSKQTLNTASGSSAGVGSGGSFNTTADDPIVFVEGSNTNGEATIPAGNSFLRFTTQSGIVSELIQVQRIYSNFSFDLGLGLLRYETFSYNDLSFFPVVFRFSYLCLAAVPPSAPNPPLLSPTPFVPPSTPPPPLPSASPPTPPSVPPPTPPPAPPPAAPSVPPPIPPSQPNPVLSPPSSPSPPPLKPSPPSPSPLPPAPQAPPKCTTNLILSTTASCSGTSTFLMEQSACLGQTSLLSTPSPYFFTPDSASCETVDVSGKEFVLPPKVKGIYDDNMCTVPNNNYAELDSTTPCTPLPFPLPGGLVFPSKTHYTLECSSACGNALLVPPSTPPPPAPPLSPHPLPPSPSPSSPPAPPTAPPSPPIDFGEDDPCFDRASTTACKLSHDVSAIEAYQVCFNSLNKSAVHAMAERVHMNNLRAGDLVLDGKNSVTRVVVNQHVHSDSTSHVLNIQHEGGLLSLTPDHMLLVDGELRPARTVTNGASLSGYKVLAVTSGRSGIINPITASGLILAASTSGQPILAATGNEWLADVMLSSYPQHTLSYTLASAFPASGQRFYDAVLEQVFNALVPRLRSLKALAAKPVVYAALVLGDLALAAAFGIFAMAASAGAILACFALAASLQLLRQKA